MFGSAADEDKTARPTTLSDAIKPAGDDAAGGGEDAGAVAGDGANAGAGRGSLDSDALGPLNRVRLWRICTAIVLAAMVGFFCATWRQIGHDPAMGMQYGQLILEGQTPFVDIFDTNPPGIMYWNVPPAALSAWLNLDARIAFYLFVGALLLVSTGLIVFCLRRAEPALWPAEIGAFVLAWLAANCLTLYGGNGFGQREHLFVLTAAPMLILRVLRRQGGAVWPLLAIALGATASAGACLKPHFVLILAFIEITLLVQRRDFRSLFDPEMLSFVAVIVAYAGHWILLPSAAGEYFFGRHLQLIARCYHVYALPFGVALAYSRSSFTLAFIALACGVIAYWRCRRPFVKLLLSALMAGILGGIAIYVSQNKGWVHHRIPFIFFSVLCSAVVFWEFIRRLAEHPDRRLLRAAVIATPFLMTGLCVLWLVFQAAPGRSRAMNSTDDFPEIEALVLKETKPRDKVLFVVTTIDPTYPMLLMTDRRPGSRYPLCYPIAFAYADIPRDTPAAEIDFESHGRDNSYEQEFLQSLRDDIRQKRPKLVFVQDKEGILGLPSHFNMSSYLERTGIIHYLTELGYREQTLPKHWRAFVAR